MILLGVAARPITTCVKHLRQQDRRRKVRGPSSVRVSDTRTRDEVSTSCDWMALDGVPLPCRQAKLVNSKPQAKTRSPVLCLPYKNSLSLRPKQDRCTDDVTQLLLSPVKISGLGFRIEDVGFGFLASGDIGAQIVGPELRV